MSYIPDYRKETDKFDENDRQFIAGYRLAYKDVLNFFDNLDVYEQKYLTSSATWSSPFVSRSFTLCSSYIK